MPQNPSAVPIPNGPAAATSGSSTLTGLLPEFLLYLAVERGFAQQSIPKYRDCLKRVASILGDREVASYTLEDVLALKRNLAETRTSPSWQNSILFSLKAFLRYCRDVRRLEVIAPEAITPVKRPRRDVLYLTSDELERFLSTICLRNRDGRPYLAGLRFRALVEVLFGTAMRISEALFLDRRQVDFTNREARIVGKGGKQRVVFFTDRALFWLKRYWDARTDDAEPAFVCQDGHTRWQRTDIWRLFARHRKLAGLSKPVRPHLLRHSAATQLLFNGCPIGHIKEILGHERLETTCRYYLGLDHRAAKAAHAQFLILGTSAAQATGSAEPGRASILPSQPYGWQR